MAAVACAADPFSAACSKSAAAFERLNAPRFPAPPLMECASDKIG